MRGRRCISVLVISFLLISVFGVVSPSAAAEETTTEEKETDIVLMRDIREDEDISFLEDFGEVLDRYGMYVMVEVSETDIEEFEEKYIIDKLEHRNRLNVKGHEFDTREGYPDFDSDLMIEGYEPGTEGIYIVDMIGPVNSEWREELESMGVEIINYQPNYAYEVVMTPELAEKVEEKFFVDWVDVYQPGFKLAEDLRSGEINIRLVEGASDETLKTLESKVYLQSVTELATYGMKVRTIVEDESIFAEIARMREVYFISNSNGIKPEDEMQTQIVGGGLWNWDPYDDPDSAFRDEELLGDYAGKAGSLANQLGYTGKGVIVAVADSGLGDGTIENAGHEDFGEEDNGRVISGERYTIEGEWVDDGWEDWIGSPHHSHGTRVAGIVAADTYEGHGGTGEYAYEDYYAGQGLAPEALIHAQQILGDGEVPVDGYEIPNQAKQTADAYIHVNSWGEVDEDGWPIIGYTETTEAYDRAVRDANDTGWYEPNEPMIITKSAGNEGYNGEEIVYNSVTAPGGGKNIITVGATENYFPPKGVENPNLIWEYSSRGWTDDNRVKPDLVAPGENVTSTHAGGDYWHGTGTSFANPAVAGAAAVVVEWYEDVYGFRPSPAMVKALLINTAQPLEEDQTGDGNVEYIPNKHEGWGMVNLANLIHTDTNFMVRDQTSLLEKEDHPAPLETGERDEYEIVVENKSEPLKITLTWTDKEGLQYDGFALKNDLNLEVESPEGNTYKGNAFSSEGTEGYESDSIYTYKNTGTMGPFYRDENAGWMDSVNNVQNVYIDPDELEPGTYTIRILAENIPVDGTNDGYENQDYALVMQNAVAEYHPWDNFRGDSKRTGRSPYGTAHVDGMEKWRFDMDGAVWSSPAVSRDGTVYVGSFDNHLYAVNSEGKEKWSFEAGDTINSTSPAIGSDGTIYVGSWDGDLYAINPDGSEKWTFSTKSSVCSSPVVGINGTIYVGSDDHILYAIEDKGESPSPRWKFRTDGAVYSSPAIGDDGTIYVGSYDNNLYAVNQNGTERWSFQTGDEVHSSPAIGEDGTIYVGSDDNNLYAVNPDGTERWSFKTGDKVRCSPAIAEDGTVYIGSHDENLYAVNPDGSERWEFSTEGHVRSTPAIGSEGSIYVGSTDNNLYGINPDGTERWRFSVGHSIYSSPAIAEDGTIYVGANDRNLYAISSYVEALSWAMFGRDRKSTGWSPYESAPLHGTEIWSFFSSWEIRSSPVIGEDGTIYVGSNDGYLYAVNSDGTEKWRFETDDFIPSSPAIGKDGTVYVGSWDNHLYAVNPDGSEEWKFETDDPIRTSPNIGGDGTIYVSSSKNLYAVSREGEKRWVFAEPEGLIESVAMSKAGTIYASTSRGVLYAVNQFDGTEEWRFDEPWLNQLTAPAVGPDGTIYVGSEDRKLYAIDPEEGSKRWSYESSDKIYSSPAINKHGTIYVVDHSGTLFALDRHENDYDLKWEHETLEKVSSSPAISADGTIYFGTLEGNVYAIKDQGYTSSERWIHDTGGEFHTGKIRSSPAIGKDGTVYIGSAQQREDDGIITGRLHAISSYAEKHPWAVFGRNLHRTGKSPYDTSEIDGVERWRFSTEGLVFSSPAIRDDGTIYVGSHDSTLYALRDGFNEPVLKWSLNEPEEEIRSSPAIGPDGTVYMGSDDGTLYAVEDQENSPDLKWSFEEPTEEISSSPIIGSNGIIYVGSDDGNLYAVEDDGNEKWVFETDGRIDSSPTISSDGTIYVGSWDNNLYAVNPDGTEKWSFETEDAVSSSPAIGEDGTIYIGSTYGNLYAIEEQGDEGASVKWVFETGGRIDSSPAIDDDDTIYVGSRDNHLYAVNPGGTEKWSFKTGDNVDSSPAIGSNGFVYVGSDDGYLYSVNSESGTEVWAFEGAFEDWDMPFRSSPAIGEDGTIYIGSYDGSLYAVSEYDFDARGEDSETIKRQTTIDTYNWEETIRLVKPVDEDIQLEIEWGDGRSDEITTTDDEWNPSNTYHLTLGSNIFEINLDVGGSIDKSIEYKLDIEYDPYEWPGPGPGPWPGPIPTGHYPYQSPIETTEIEGERKWAFETNGKVRSTPVTIRPNGTVYFGSEDGKLYAVDSGGTEIWSFQTEASISSAPVVDRDGDIYIGSEDGSLYALDPNGAKRWEFSTGGPIESTPAIGEDGTIYVGSTDKRVYAINPDGSEIWSFETGGAVSSSPTIGPYGRIYFGSTDGNLYALNSSGREKWSFSTRDPLTSSPTIGIDGTIYIGSHDHSMYAIDIDGTEIWSFETDGAIESSASLGNDETLYFGSTDGNLYALNPWGTEKWNFSIEKSIRSSPAISGDGTVYVGSDDGNLYAITLEGEEKWAYPTDDSVVSSPIIADRGTIYVGSDDGNLHAIGLYLVDNWYDLHEVGNALGENYTLGFDLDAQKAGYEELVATADGWVPIGEEENSFTGIFGGEGHTIADLHIDRPGEDEVGLFGHIGENGSIQDVNIREAEVTGGEKVGSLVGHNRGELRNISVTGQITGDKHVGGLVGTNRGNVTNIESSAEMMGGERIGVLIGNNRGILTCSYSSGGVEGDGELGGLAGLNRGEIRETHSTANVSGSEKGGGSQRVGGLVGWNRGVITLSHSSGEVTGSRRVGGLVGWNHDHGELSYSYSLGDVTGDRRVGGFVGWNKGEIVDTYVRGDVTGDRRVGGFVGWNHGTISNSYSTGVVTGNRRVGGFAGWNLGEISSSFWDIETSGQDESNGGIGKPTEDMQSLTTFEEAGWDITAVPSEEEKDTGFVWNIVDGETYPFLSGRGEEGENSVTRFKIERVDIEVIQKAGEKKQNIVVTAEYPLTNTGDKTITENIEFFILDLKTDSEVKFYTEEVTLKNGETYDGKMLWETTTEEHTGSYLLRVENGDRTVEEEVEIPSGDDFTLSDLRVGQKEVETGEDLDLQIDVEYTGMEKIDYTVEFGLDGEVVGTDTITLEGGETKTASITHTVEEEEEHVFEAGEEILTLPLEEDSVEELEEKDQKSPVLHQARVLILMMVIGVLMMVVLLLNRKRFRPGDFIPKSSS